MQFWVGITDNQWFRFLAPRKLEEVNFWQPSSKILFSVYRVPIGMPFLFKLKSPYNHIGGGGFFVGTCSLPLHLAWEIFGEKKWRLVDGRIHGYPFPHFAQRRQSQDSVQYDHESNISGAT